MSGTKSLVQIPPDSTGKKMDTRKLDDGDGNLVERQAVCIGAGERSIEITASKTVAEARTITFSVRPV